MMGEMMGEMMGGDDGGDDVETMRRRWGSCWGR